MFEKFITGSERDFHQRYQNTYGYFISKGKRTLVKLSEVDSAAGRVLFVDKDNQTYVLHRDAEGDTGFEFIPPVCKWHNTSVGALLVSRIPQRQYSRGICDKNTMIQDINTRAIPVGFHNLHQIYDSTLTPKQGHDSRGSFAVSPSFAVNPTSGYLMLFSQVIGSAGRVAETHTIKLNDPNMFRTEVSDAFRRANIEAVIT